jgi:Iron-containing redox enzyme
MSHPIPTLPRPRGPLSQWVLERCTRSTDRPAPGRPADGLGEDAQLALYLCYETHFAGAPRAVRALAWDPVMIELRRDLDASFVDGLTQVLPPPVAGAAVDIVTALHAQIEADDGPSLSRYMERHGQLGEMREFVLHRSAYQLKEGDGHTYAIPQLDGRPKQILVEIQAGEYGADVPGRLMHRDLFAATMRALGLDDRPNAYLDELPASALMISNLISLFGLNPRWRGALVGQLAVFEMTSVVPMGRYSRGLVRMGAPEEARRFYDVHVVADAEHELMVGELVRELLRDEADLRDDVMFGARAALAVERIFAEGLLGRWSRRLPPRAA